MICMNRRTCLGLISTLTITGAGCVGSSSGPEAESSETTTGEVSVAPSATPGSTEQPTSRQSDRSETPVHEEYETTQVTIVSQNQKQRGEVTAAIADTSELRHLGLSDTESLPENRGMLFVHDAVQELTYVMREMDFAIDIIFADGDGVITGIHHARAPEADEDGNDLRYPGRGQFVLEVNRDWTTDRGIGEGDSLEFTLQ